MTGKKISTLPSISDSRFSNAPKIEWIEQVAITELIEYDGHARRHSRSKLRKLRNNINQFGFITPLIINSAGTVVAGHARLKVARELGIKEVPAIRVFHLSNEQVRAYRISDNRLVEDAEWDTEALANEFGELLCFDLDLSLSGFEVPEIDHVLSLHEDGSEDEVEETPELPHQSETVTRFGDLWKLGNHLLYCGDARCSEPYRELTNGIAANLVFSDPPYNVPINGHVSGKGKTRHQEFAMASGEMSDRDFIEFLGTVINHARSHASHDAAHYYCIDWRHQHHLTAAAIQANLQQINLCVWAKSNGGMGSLYRSQHELVPVFANQDAKVCNNVQLGKFGRNRSNCSPSTPMEQLEAVA